MRIQLKQTEIETAIKEFLIDMGIDTHYKKVSMTFTAGRKNSGLSADIMIEENFVSEEATSITLEVQDSTLENSNSLTPERITTLEEIAPQPASLFA